MYLGKAISIIKNGKVISLNGRKQDLMNRVILLVGPLLGWGTRIMKPSCGTILKIMGLGNHGK